MEPNKISLISFEQLASQIKTWARELGFSEARITSANKLDKDYERLLQWVGQKYHGSMAYLERNPEMRADPQQLLPGTLRIITVRLDYLPPEPKLWETLKNPSQAYISRYALGKDYHRLIRKRLKALALKITGQVGEFAWRPFSDSAPVFEKPLAAQSGLGWVGKNTLILNKKAGSYFFLGSLFINLPLPTDPPVAAHCGNCRACLDLCPTQAFAAPYILDARRCISYLTIENKGPIPLSLRPLMGNRIFGCDDCQLVCPWNKYAKTTQESAFYPRHRLDAITLLEIFSWTEAQYLENTLGSALRRSGYFGFIRNIAVALGNAPSTPEKTKALATKLNQPALPDWVKEHIVWAIARNLDSRLHRVDNSFSRK